MKASKLALLCAIAFTQVDNVSAHRLVQTEQGIFGKMIENELAATKVDSEIEDARKRKAQQMIDAEKEHEALV
jgi:hypothetical protein